MKILMMFHFSPNPPPRDLGPAKRSFPFLRETLKRHQVSVLTFGSRDEEQSFKAEFGDHCQHIVFVNNQRPRFINFFRRAIALIRGKGFWFTLRTRKMQQELDALVRQEQFDIIYCASALLGAYRFPKGIPRVGDTHNVEYDLMYRGFREAKGLVNKAICYLEYKFGKSYELTNCKTFDTLIATTQRDHDVFRSELPHQNITVIQNGVDPSFLEPLGATEEPRTMIFMGLMRYFPNQHGIMYFLDEILPLVLEQVPTARLFVVGKSPSKALRARASNNVVVTGFVDDVRPFVARSQIFIIPLLIGGGIRGKALEAMAMRKAIVSTTIGCEGIHLVDKESALFADTPIDFANSIIRLFHDDQLRSRLGQQAYETVLRDYNWENKGQQLEAVYRSVLNLTLTPSLHPARSFRVAQT